MLSFHGFAKPVAKGHFASLSFDTRIAVTVAIISGSKHFVLEVVSDDLSPVVLVSFTFEWTVLKDLTDLRDERCLLLCFTFLRGSLKILDLSATQLS